MRWRQPPAQTVRERECSRHCQEEGLAGGVAEVRRCLLPMVETPTTKTMDSVFSLFNTALFRALYGLLKCCLSSSRQNVWQFQCLEFSWTRFLKPKTFVNWRVFDAVKMWNARIRFFFLPLAAEKNSLESCWAKSWNLELLKPPRLEWGEKELCGWLEMSGAEFAVAKEFAATSFCGMLDRASSKYFLPVPRPLSDLGNELGLPTGSTSSEIGS